MNNTREEELIEKYIIREYFKAVGILAALAEAGIHETVLMERLSEQMVLLRAKITKRVEVGITRAWNASNKATFTLMDKKFANKVDLPESVAKVIYDPNQNALEAFIKREKGGLNLSDRIWDQAKESRKIIKRGLKTGIDEGKPAREIAKEIREALLEPSIPTPAGVYKSPFKNAMRVVRTEVNGAYRTADQANWNKNPLVLGYKIAVSNTKSKNVKARCELCVKMAGTYPNTFKWSAWHPNCLCIKTPITLSREYMDEYNKLIARGEDTREAVANLRKRAGLVEDLPQHLVDYVKGGGGAKSWWYSDNKKMFSND